MVNTVYIIRHCDKPIEAKELHECLCSEQGYLRSYLLPYFIHKHIKTVNHLIAANYSPNDKNCDCSQREKLVLIPTSEALNLQIELPCCFDQIEIAKEFILNKEGVVLVAWEHRHVPLLTKALGVKSDIPAWNSARFDQVFKIQFDNNNKVKSFTVFTEGLGLYNDSCIPQWTYIRFTWWFKVLILVHVFILLFVIIRIVNK